MEGIIPYIFNGLSISSILLLTALGLSIIFGLMGVINFAHGEFIMIGCYSSYILHEMIGIPSSWFTLLLTFILAFFMAFVLGMILERIIIRYLYGRPLDSILATWGISLILQQLARMIFGPNNVEAKIPSLLTHGVEVTETLTFSNNRIFIIVFCLIVFFVLNFFVYKTPKGRQIQAVTQNRIMASSIGINTKKIDAFAFSLGCGLAGLAGVCISMLGAVGPSTGQNYIIDTFLVVILGGVGGFRGAVIASLLIGISNPLIESFTNSSMAKALVLTLVIILLQFKPQGLSPLKSRSVD